MQINITFTANVSSAMQAAVNAAVQYYDSLITNNITLNIKFDFASLSGGVAQSSFGVITSSKGAAISYSQYRAALLNVASTATTKAAANALPTTDPLAASFGNSNVGMTVAQAKLLGFHSSTTNSDGTVTLGSSINWDFSPTNRAVPGQIDAVGAIEHEISEILGRDAGSDGSLGLGTTPMPLDFFRYSSAGAVDTSASYSGAYFSLDGQTLLQAMGEKGADLADWASGVSGDSYGYASSGRVGTVTAVDTQVLSAMGYAIAPSAALSVTVSNDSFSASGAPITIAANLSGTIINGASNIITAASGVSLSVDGTNNAVTAANGDTLAFSGATSGASENALTTNSSNVSVAGANYLSLSGYLNTVSTTGTGANIQVLGTGGDSDNIHGDGAVISVASGSSINYYGNGGSIVVGANATVGVYGTDEVSASAGSTVTLVNAQGPTVLGSNFTFTFVGISSASLNGSNDVVTVGGGDTLVVTGNNETMTIAGTSDSVTLSGTGEAVTFASADNYNTVYGGAGNDSYAFQSTNFGHETLYNFVATGTSHDVLQFSTQAFADWAHLLGATTQQGADVLITLDANDTLLLKNVTLANFTAADARFV